MPYYRCFSSVLGTPFFSTQAGGNNGLTATAKWVAISFIAPVTATLNQVRAYVGARNGTLAAGHSTINIFSSTFSLTTLSHQPLSSLHGPVSCSSAISAVGFYNWAPSYAVTAGTPYWIVFKNTHGTPASNNYALAVSNSSSLTLGSNAYTLSNLVHSHTTDSGATWSRQGMGSIRLGFSDGSYFGFPWSTIIKDSSFPVYSTREHGTKFSVPANLNIKVIGLGMACGPRVNSPSQLPRLRLWTGATPTLQATANLPAMNNVDSSMGHSFSYFSSPVTLTAGTVCRVTLGEATNADGASTYYQNIAVNTDTDPNSLQLVPYSACRTYYNGSSWSDTANIFTPFSLILDDTDEYQSGGGGGPTGPSIGHWLTRAQAGKG